MDEIIATAARTRDQSSAAEHAAAAITQLVEQASPGDRLGTKAELRELVGVSVGTFNEALRVLQTRRIVSLRSGPGGGLFVAEQSPMVKLGHSVLALDTDVTTVAEAIRIRDALDPLIIDDVLYRAAPADVEAMYAIVRKMKSASDVGDGTEFVHMNWLLHRCIANVASSGVLGSIYCGLLDLIESHTLEVLPAQEVPLPTYLNERYELHRSIVDAIAQRDSDEAHRLIELHNTADPPDRGSEIATTDDL